MDSIYGSDRKVDHTDFMMDDFLESDMFPSSDALVSDQYMDNDWFSSLFEDPVLNDKMITDAVQSPRITSEHSYSLNNDCPDSPLGLVKIEDMNREIEFDMFSSSGALDLSQRSSHPMVTIKQEPIEPAAAIIGHLSHPGIIVQAAPTLSNEYCFLRHDTAPESNSLDSSGADSVSLPPTPPSSNTSDSEGGQSPTHSVSSISSPVRQFSLQQQSPSKAFCQTLFTNPIPQSGILILSEEEKRTLISEGYPIPQKLPLTKHEEKNLKKIRRKIKNKISAQESRRKKKEYLETLEKRVESFTQENTDLKKKVEHMETNNRSLLNQLQKLQTLVGKVGRSSAASPQTGTVLMVLVLCFAVFLGSWAPTSLNIGYSNSRSSSGGDIFFQSPRLSRPSPAMGPQLKNVHVDAYSTSNLKSRVLLWDRDESDEEENLVYGPYAPYMPSRADEPSMCAERATPQPQSSRPLGPSELQVSMTNAVSSVVLDARHINLTWEPAETALPEMTASPVKIDLM